MTIITDENSNRDNETIYYPQDMSQPLQELDMPQEYTDYVYVPMAYDSNSSAASTSQLIDALLPEWNSTSGETQFVKLTQGISNVMFKVFKSTPETSNEPKDEESLVIRAYGNGTEVLVDREQELFFHKVLARHGLASPVLARFQNGFIYRFVPGISCSDDQLQHPEIWRGVALEMAKWHAIEPSSFLQQVPKVSSGHDEDAALQYREFFESKHAPALHITHKVARTKPNPNIWSTMQAWIMLLPANTEEQRLERETLGKELERLAGDYGAAGTLGQNRYVLAHCDLLSGNIIIKPSHRYTDDVNQNVVAVNFIDFEHAKFAPAAFDIVSHFSEWAGFECDYSRLPTRSIRRAFLREYVRGLTHTLGSTQATSLPNLVPPVEELMEEVDLLRALPSFFWGICSLVQGTASSSFEHKMYAALRLREYWDWRAEVDGTRVRTGGVLPAREARWFQET